MRRAFLFTAALIFALPACLSDARAQDNVIRIINEDGTVQEVEMPTRQAPPMQVERPVPQPRVEQAPAAPQQPARAPEIDIPEVNPEMPETMKAIVEPVVSPPQSTDDVLQPQLEASGDEVSEDALSEEEYEEIEWTQSERQLPEGYVVLPGRKPAVPYRHAKPDYNSMPAVSPTGPITKGEAITIAMEKAPPSSSVMAALRNHNGAAVYLVTFRTENGPVDIVVDVATGEIVK